jgi:hypothetical protein
MNDMPDAMELLHSNLHEVFSERNPERRWAAIEQIGADLAALAWRVGPPDRQVARGIDIFTIRDGRVSAVRTLIAP